jgi:AcrR family transcriptional regulator
MREESRLLQKYATVLPYLNERQRRLVAAADAQMLGYGGIARVARASGLNRSTLHRGFKDLAEPALPAERVRQVGGGRKRVREQTPAIMQELEQLVDPLTRGDPQSPLRWTCKSTRQLARTLTARGYGVSYRVVGELLRELGYSLQANAKTLEGASHPDRNAQFEYLNAQVQTYLAKRWPVISVDAKKKELVGQYHNGGREWQPQGQPEQVNVHDFPDPQLGKAIPYGIDDVGRNLGWVNVGCDHDTASFAVESIRRWWIHMGRTLYKKAKPLLICADSGGSNGYRVRLWKVELQKLADTLGVVVTVCHLPPGTSKWNKIEHRLFSHISLNWRGRPLVSHEVIVALIGATTTQTGLRVEAQLDRQTYPTRVEVSDEQLARVRLCPHQFHGEWNYSILPRQAETVR